MGATVLNAFFLGLLLCILFSCVSLWFLIFERLSRRAEIVPYEPRRSAPWGAGEVLLAIVVFFAMQFVFVAPLLWWKGMPERAADSTAAMESTEATDAATAGASQEVEPSVDAVVKAADSDVEDADDAALPADGDVGASMFDMMIAALGGQLVGCALFVSWLNRRGMSLKDVGLDFSRWAFDFRIGLGGFLAAAVPVLFVQYVLSLYIKAEHPIQDLLLGNNGWLVNALTALMAVVVAPLSEEFLFRVILQGWLERLFLGRARSRAAHSLVAVDEIPADDNQAQDTRTEVVVLDTPSEFADVSAAHAVPVGPDESSPARRPAVMPILLSSLVFALVHLGYGPSPIPLFLFALMLGYLYRQTHRLLPSVVAHACLNLLSTIGLLLQSLGGE